jgi:hypothetical protein
VSTYASSSLPAFEKEPLEPTSLGESVRLEELEETFVPKDEAEFESSKLGPTGLKNPFWS